MENLSFSGSIESFNKVFTPFSEELEPIIYTIRKAFQTEMIFLLGVYQANPKVLGKEYDLLVLAAEQEKRPMHEFESLIYNRCHDFAVVSVSVHRWDTIQHLLSSGNIFFSQLCKPEKLIYDSGERKLTGPILINPAIKHANLLVEFRQMLEKAKGFLLGSSIYKAALEYQLGAFMLHQAAEQTLNAFLCPLMGLRLQTHNLQKLLLYTRRLSEALYYAVFPRNSGPEIQLFQLLQKAYIYGRYKNNFQVSQDNLETLTDRVIFLQEMVSRIFPEKLNLYFEKQNPFIPD
jgi:uncharacterized protein